MVVLPMDGPVSVAAGATRVGAATVTATGPTDSATKAKAAMLSAPGTLNGPPSGNNHAIPLSARRAEALDLSTVERRDQPKSIPNRPAKRQRPWNQPEAPTYRPTKAEFRDPMEYIRKIAPEGRKYGIIKIIPPEDWNPPLAINTERFHFRTRRQELNSVEGGNRVNHDYLDQLARFHKQNGHNLNRFPSVDKRPLDLYRLKKTVERKGGFDMVCKMKRWAEVGRDLGYSGKIMSSLSTSLKNSYQKWLHPYEEYLKVAKPGVHQHMEMLNGGPYTPSPGASPAKKSQVNSPLGASGEAVRASSAALNANLNGHGSQSAATTSHSSVQIAPSTGTGGGFTAVNAGGFTAVNTQPATTSFTSVNGANGTSHSNKSTPQRVVEAPTQNNNEPNATPGTETSSKRQLSESNMTAEEIEAMNRRSKRLRKDVSSILGSNMQHSRMSARSTPVRDRSNFKTGENCEKCARTDDTPHLLECANCDSVYHMYCLEPSIQQKPEHEWNCPRCLVGTNDYGFEEGDVYSLSGFQKRANEFKANHFKNLPSSNNTANGMSPSNLVLSEYDVEMEYLRLVGDIRDTTEVEYGADIHSTIHGSGFPTIEKQPRDPYSIDPWNLNMLPLDKDSLFRHIKSDVSGMTVPWLYVGMVFSTFCWHNEDHYTYSINYQHFGDTKTWYGIPGEDSEKFEQALKDEFPELFESQPDLLFQLVTLMRPRKLSQAQVQVYAIDQHAGEFVITFPRAFHAGFNHGFNLNEAVNFAPADWEPFGDEGVKRLRTFRRQPCFSHDELLLTAAARDNTIRTAKWLAPALERMRDEEHQSRTFFLSGSSDGADADVGEAYTGPRYTSAPRIIDPEGDDDDEAICVFCKAYCYLSRYLCRKTRKTICLQHAGSHVCCDAVESERYSGENGEHELQFRMTDEALDAIVAKVVDKANSPEMWLEKVNKELEDNAQPSLKHLRTLLAEGEKIQYDLPQLPELRNFVERCNEWVEEAINYITRKQQNRRKNEKAWRKGSKAAEIEERDRELRSVENIESLLAAAKKLGFDCPEIHTLRERYDNIRAFQGEALRVYRDYQNGHQMGYGGTLLASELETLLERGKEFHVDMPEMEHLEQILKRIRWDETAEAKRPNPETGHQPQTYKDIEDFINEGIALGIPQSHPVMQFYLEHRHQAEVWEQKAKELMSVEQVHYQQLDALSSQAHGIPVSTETLAAVEGHLRKQREVQERIIRLIGQCKDPNFRKRPFYKEAQECKEALEELQSKPSGAMELEMLIKSHADWMRKGKKLFGKANAPLHILHQHMNIVKEKNEYCFDLRDKPRMPVEPASRQHTPEEGIPISTDESSSSRDVFCICRKVEAGMMIECEICHEWYHGKCLKIARGKVKEDDKYTCPICDHRVKIPRDAARPKLEELQAWHDELETLPFQPEEEETLVKIVADGAAFRDFMRPLINPENPTTPEEIGTLRFHLRKIEGADILLAEETNYLRQELHKWAPVAPEPPPVVEVSASTRKPRPTKLQKAMAHHGVTNPDDLPASHKQRGLYLKRKGSEAVIGKKPIQPAGPSMSPGASGSPQPSTAGQSASPGPPRFFTALALQVLEELADHAVVSPMLAAEPHMNSDKLTKMKWLLEHEPATRDDVALMKKRMSTLQLPTLSGQPVSYETLRRTMSKPQTTEERESPLFATATPTDLHGDGSGHMHSSVQYSPNPYPSRTSPTSHAFEAAMFDSTAGSNYMFESPVAESKAVLASPEYDEHTEVRSPGFAASPTPADNIDPVFSEMMNDHDEIVEARLAPHDISGELTSSSADKAHEGNAGQDVADAAGAASG